MTTPCFGRHDLFDATDLRSHRQAKAICAGCPALAACRRNLDDARRDQLMTNYGPEGTWAGQLLKAKGSGA